MTGPTYTEEEIKTAIREELEAEGHMGKDKDRYYTIMGIVSAALKRMMKNEMNIKDYLHFYLGQKAIVQVNFPGNEVLTGTICEVTRNSNHGDWVEVRFESCERIYKPHYNGDGSSSNMHHFFMGEDMVKPILRRSESLTKEENKQLGKVMYNMITGETHYSPEQFHYLLSLGIDLFGLIEAGLAMDAETLK